MKDLPIAILYMSNSLYSYISNILRDENHQILGSLQLCELANISSKYTIYYDQNQFNSQQISF